jgi:hypothetical protein
LRFLHLVLAIENTVFSLCARSKTLTRHKSRPRLPVDHCKPLYSGRPLRLLSVRLHAVSVALAVACCLYWSCRAGTARVESNRRKICSVPFRSPVISYVVKRQNPSAMPPVELISKLSAPGAFLLPSSPQLSTTRDRRSSGPPIAEIVSEAGLTEGEGFGA